MYRNSQPQNRLRKLLGTVLTSVLAVASASIAEEWRLLTDQRDMRDLIYLDGRIWCATTGGLTSFDLQERRFQGYTTVDGLDGVAVSHLAPDGEGRLWLALENKAIQLYDPHRGVIQTVESLKDDAILLRLNDLIVDSRGVFIATNQGIARLTYVADLDRWVWLERYTRLGDLPLEEEANCLIIQGDYIWVGTRSGVARGDLNTPLPLDWVNYNVSDGLASDTIRDLAIYQNDIYAATDLGVCRWKDNAWSLINGSRGVFRLEVVSDTLRVIGRYQIYYWTGDRLGVTASDSVLNYGAAWDDSGGMWTALTRNGQGPGGLSLWTSTGWERHIPDGPVTNFARAFAFTPSGELLLVGGLGGGEFGLSVWDGSIWRRWSRPEATGRALNYENRSVTADLDGGVWVGTYGGGIARYNPDGTINGYNQSPETGSRLSGNGEGTPLPDYVTAGGIALDAEGNLWVVNRGAINGNILVCVPRQFIQNPSSDQEWIYFHRSLFNNFQRMEFIAIDGRGRKWLASADQSTNDLSRGVYVFDERGTLDDPSDDQVWGPIPGLNIPQIYSITWDPAGYIWAGSLDGAYYVNADVDDLTGQRFTLLYQLRQQAVNAIAVDPSGNKWFGTNDGVVIVAPDLYTVLRRITATAPDQLPVPTVNCLGVNPVTGWAYMGTNSGTAALQTPYRQFGDRIEQVSVEPNPFNPDQGRMFFTGSSLAGGASARVYTPDGRLVRYLSHEEAALGWNGTDDLNRRVADGVYLILTNDASGNSGSTKIAVLRR